MQYNVIFKTVVNIKVPGVEADSQQQAIARAEQQTDFDLAAKSGVGVEYVEYAEELLWTIVDEHGDEDFERSGTYKNDNPMGPSEWRKAAEDDA